MSPGLPRVCHVPLSAKLPPGVWCGGNEDEVLVMSHPSSDDDDDDDYVTPLHSLHTSRRHLAFSSRSSSVNGTRQLAMKKMLILETCIFSFSHASYN